VTKSTPRRPSAPTLTRLQQLVAAHGDIHAAALTPERLYERIAAVAVELTGAAFGGVAVLEDGRRIRRIQTGPDGERDAPSPGASRLDALLLDVAQGLEPLRIDDTEDDARLPAAVGVRPIRSFLAVPVRVHGESFGALFVADPEPARFGAELEGNLTALAGTAGLAIDRTTLHRSASLRARISQAVAEVASALVAEHAEDAIPVVAEQIADLSGADSVSIIVEADDDRLVIEYSLGIGTRELTGRSYPRAGSAAALALDSGQPFLVGRAGFGEPDLLGPMIVVPLTARGTTIGALIAAREEGADEFTNEEFETAVDFAGQAAVALVIARGRAELERLNLLEDRSRIARDLHDHVIQRLFAAGLSLQAALPRVADPDVRAIVEDQVTALDTAIAEIRTAISAMTAEHAERETLRHRVIDAIGSMTHAFPVSPELSFAGAVDLLVPETMHDDVVAVVREGLANAAKHANATRCSVSVVADEEAVVVEVVDDGNGMPERPPRRSGTGNLSERAGSWGGSMHHEPNIPKGTRLVWRAPYRSRSTE